MPAGEYLSAPDGATYEGYAACLKFWQGIAASRGNRFTTEEVLVLGEHAISRWRLNWGTGAKDSVRGVNLMRIVGGRIVEARGYIKS